MNNRRHRINKLIEQHQFLTDGGLETVLIFLKDVDLPCFAAFDLLSRDWGATMLEDYYRDYLRLAAQHKAGFVLETPTWRASHGWGAQLGYNADEIADANRQAVALMERIREAHNDVDPVLISGNIGPKGDGYVPGDRMSAEEATEYHGHQIRVFADTAADLVTALTLNYVEEAIGIARAAQEASMPVVLSFTVETDGRLPNSQALGDAITQVDEATESYASYYMINCAHPTHFEHMLAEEGTWRERVRGVRGNASKCSHAELDESEVLDDGNPGELGEDYKRLKAHLPRLRVYGGCCGTDHRHVGAIASTCLV
jgi:S-methylmethionine-dependent homocysteine/selenocysteine methylase